MPRRYRLSPDGLRALRETIRRNRPWEKSTGPRTEDGKARAKVNAVTHGERMALAEAQRAARVRMLRELAQEQRPPA